MAAHAGPEAQATLLSPSQPNGPTLLAERLQAAAITRRVTIATAESCTGGLIGHIITDVPGSSAYYRGGIVSYSNEVKVQQLGVDVAALERHGAVSAQVALAMAHGVRTRLQADYGVAVTGVAGPAGGSPDKPVGLVYVAATGYSLEEVRRFHWSGDRSSNKQDSAVAALELLLEMLAGDAVASATA